MRLTFSPGGGIGRHKGLKIPRRKLRAGSSPAPGTIFKLDYMKAKKDRSKCIWVLVYTKAKQEKRANENLKKQGFKTFLPMVLKSKNGRKINKPVPIFPRYLFVEIDLSLNNWSVVNSSYGVSNIVMFSEEFTPISPKIILAMRKKLDAQDVYKEDVSIIDFQRGDSVSIERGRLAGIDAVFLSKKSNDRVTLLLKLLNTTVTTDLHKSNLGNKEIIKSIKF
tara:strand:+ start:80 stop:745 length:666 start_codon:yes stop_codon:yes gene_type:complete